MDSFVHLHVHSHYSVLDGMSGIPDLVDKAYKSGMNAVALTDHGSMFGVKEFYNYVKKKNSKVHCQVELIQKKLGAEGITEEEKAELLKRSLTKDELFGLYTELYSRKKKFTVNYKL